MLLHENSLDISFHQIYSLQISHSKLDHLTPMWHLQTFPSNALQTLMFRIFVDSSPMASSNSLTSCGC